MWPKCVAYNQLDVCWPVGIQRIMGSTGAFTFHYSSVLKKLRDKLVQSIYLFPQAVDGQLLNKTYAEIIRKTKIKPDKTFQPKYYGGYYGKEDFGTSHVSILAENGDAVSVTGTVNYL